jgi:tellurite resistance protein TerC
VDCCGHAVWRLCLHAFGSDRGIEFFTGYFLEKALAVDNLFVFAVIFTHFGIPAGRQHRVLFWGVFGALVFRAIFVALGFSLLSNFHWIAYVFGSFLALTGLKLLGKPMQLHPGANPLFRALPRMFPVTNVDTDHFFVRGQTKVRVTSLFLSLIVVEICDFAFALDSIPAIFSVTSDAFIVFTSNVFAVLGLRAMYSLVAEFIVRLKYLYVGLALVLIFAGSKMLIREAYQMPPLVSLGVVAVLIVGSTIASLISGTASQSTRAFRHSCHLAESEEAPRDETA